MTGQQQKSLWQHKAGSGNLLTEIFQDVKKKKKKCWNSFFLIDLRADLFWLLYEQPQVEAQPKPGVLFQTAKCFSRGTNSHTAKHTYIQLHHKHLWALSYSPTHIHHTETETPPLSPSFFLPLSLALPYTLIQKVAVFQFQLLAWNLWIRGQGQLQARRFLFLLVFLLSGKSSNIFPLTPSLPAFFQDLSAWFLFFILCQPLLCLPPITWCHGGLKQNLKICVWQRKTGEKQFRGRSNVLVTPPRRPVRGGMGTLSSSIPWTWTQCFCSFTTSHRLVCWAYSSGMRFLFDVYKILRFYVNFIFCPPIRKHLRSKSIWGEENQGTES